MNSELVSIESEPLDIICKVNNANIKFEVDTGSFISTINEDVLGKLRNVKILRTSKRAKGYGNSIIDFAGEVNLEVKFKKRTVTHTFLIVKAQKVSLLGRDLCKKLGIKISFPTHEYTVNSLSNCNVLKKYSKYLSADFQTNVKQEVSFDIDPSTRATFCKTRSVPFKYKDLVKTELDRLEKSGVITKVFRSNWACPTVNVLKSDDGWHR